RRGAQPGQTRHRTAGALQDLSCSAHGRQLLYSRISVALLMEVAVVDLVQVALPLAQVPQLVPGTGQRGGDLRPDVLAAHRHQQRALLLDLVHTGHLAQVRRGRARVAGDADLDHGAAAGEPSGQLLDRADGDEPAADEDADPVTHLLDLV